MNIRLFLNYKAFTYELRKLYLAPNDLSKFLSDNITSGNECPPQQSMTHDHTSLLSLLLEA